MGIYKFYDWNSYTDEDQNLSRNEYVELFRCCCKQCTVMSLIFRYKDTCFQDDLEKFRIVRPNNINYNFPHYNFANLNAEQIDVRYYRISEELYKTLISSVQGIYDWIYGWGNKNPEDPTFYRDDGSVFFTSIIHEGELSLYVKENENVETIVSNNQWEKVE